MKIIVKRKGKKQLQLLERATKILREYQNTVPCAFEDSEYCYRHSSNTPCVNERNKTLLKDIANHTAKQKARV